MTGPGTFTASNANAYAQQIAEFNRQTRNRNYKLPGQQRATNNLLLRFDLPPSYLVGRIKIDIRGTILAVTAGTPNPLGLAAIVKNVRVQSNMGDDLVNLSGPQYFLGLASVLDFPGNVIPQATLGAIAAAAPVNLPIIIPFAVNLRDATGLIPLQNRQTVATLWVELETNAVLNPNGITWTTEPIVTPTVECFTIPFMPTAQPPISMLHRIIGFNTAISATSGDIQHVWDRGNIVLQKIHQYGAEVTSPTDSWSKVRLVAQQTDNLYIYENNATNNDQDVYFNYQRLQARRVGNIYFDFVGQSGLGIYDIPRDAIDMRRYTDMASVITITAAKTLQNITRYLQPIA